MSGELIDGHSLSAEQIAKHGRDRFPTVEKNAAHLCAEAGELMSAIEHHHAAYADHPGQCAHTIAASIRKEVADVGLTLYALCGKLALRLDEVMADLVDHDQRDFSQAVVSEDWTGGPE